MSGIIGIDLGTTNSLAFYPDRTASVFKRFMGNARKYQLGDKRYLPEEKKLVIVNKNLEMTQEEIDEKLKEFEKVKRPFADERNTYILEWGQWLFMQSSIVRMIQQTKQWRILSQNGMAIRYVYICRRISI